MGRCAGCAPLFAQLGTLFLPLSQSCSPARYQTFGNQIAEARTRRFSRRRSLELMIAFPSCERMGGPDPIKDEEPPVRAERGPEVVIDDPGHGEYPQWVDAEVDVISPSVDARFPPILPLQSVLDVHWQKSVTLPLRPSGKCFHATASSPISLSLARTDKP